MSLLQKCWQFLVNHFEDNHSLIHFELTATQWKALVREHLIPIIEKELQVKQIADFVWASEYNSLGMRKVISFFYLNNAYATFKWGWNFEFIPKCSGSKVVWARTDKSIYTHVYELSKDFYNSDGTNRKKREAYDRTIVSRYFVIEKNAKNVIEKIVKDHKKMLKYLLPTIQEYYRSTETMELILRRIDLNLENPYYRFINPGLLISKVFILYYLKSKEKAISDFEKIPFQCEDIKNQYYKKLLSMEEYSPKR